MVDPKDVARLITEDPDVPANAMVVHVWDEIGGEWGRFVLNLTNTDPAEINRAVGVAVAGDDEGDGWEVEASSRTGPVLTIVSRSDRGHLCIIIVNMEEAAD